MRFRLIAFLGSMALALPLLLVADVGSTDRSELSATSTRNHTQGITSDAQWQAGSRNGVAISNGSLTVSRPTMKITRARQTFDLGSWTSGWIRPGFGFNEVIPSWSAATPGRSFVIVHVRTRSTAGTLGTWQKLATWSTAVGVPELRSSADAQTDAISTVATDTLRARSGHRFASYQLRYFLARPVGQRITPTLMSTTTLASLTGSIPAATRRALPARTLAVPTYSQMIHRGEYPQFGGGGQAWCSPTSLAMVLAFHRALPTHTSWVTKGTDRFVDEVARRVYDSGYDGAGNWAFNTAYAASRGLNAHVTRLPNLRAAESYIAAGLPLIASISFVSGQLRGAPIRATAGHLVVIVGFTAAGNVVVNDPAASTNAGVRRTYDRAQFEAAWHRKSHGLVYAVKRYSQRWPS